MYIDFDLLFDFISAGCIWLDVPDSYFPKKRFLDLQTLYVSNFGACGLYCLLLKTGSFYNAIREFSLA